MVSFSKPKPSAPSQKPVLGGKIRPPRLVREEVRAAAREIKEQTGKPSMLDQKEDEGKIKEEQQKADQMRLAAIRKRIAEIKEEAQQAREAIAQEEERRRQIREEAFGKDEGKDKSREENDSLPAVIGLPPGGGSSSKPKSHLPPGLGAEKRRRR